MRDIYNYDDCANRLRAIAEPTRLQLLQHIAKNADNVTKIGQALGWDIVKTSHHLNVLRAVGVVVAKRHGRELFYHLVPGVAELHQNGALIIDVGCCAFRLPGEGIPVNTLTIGQSILTAQESRECNH